MIIKVFVKTLLVRRRSRNVDVNTLSILSETYNAPLFSFDYFYVNAHALSKLFHSINSLFNQASNHVLVFTRCSQTGQETVNFIDEGWSYKNQTLNVLRYKFGSVYMPTSLSNT